MVASCVGWKFQDSFDILETMLTTFFRSQKAFVIIIFIVTETFTVVADYGFFLPKKEILCYDNMYNH